MVYTSVVPALGRLRQKNHRFEASLGYSVSQIKTTTTKKPEITLCPANSTPREKKIRVPTKLCTHTFSASLGRNLKSNQVFTLALAQNGTLFRTDALGKELDANTAYCQSLLMWNF